MRIIKKILESPPSQLSDVSCQTSDVSCAPRGVVALISLLVIMTVLVSIGITISAVGQNEIVLSGVFQDGEQAFAIADACVEEGIQRFKSNGAYAGGTFTLDGGTCAIAVANLGGDTRLVTGTGVYRRNTRIIEANVTLHLNAQGNAKNVGINSWREAD